MNKVLLVGNLVRDPEAGSTNGGITYSRFSLAVNRNYSNANGEREADFLNIVAWRKLAETCNTYLKKGNKVGIVGSIQTRTYEVEGQKRYATEVVADEIEFLTSRNDSNQTSAPQRKVKESVNNLTTLVDEDLPF